MLNKAVMGRTFHRVAQCAGLYEYFKHKYAVMAGPENAAKYQTILFLAGSASAEFFADIGCVSCVMASRSLCPHTFVCMHFLIPAHGTCRGIDSGCFHYTAAVALRCRLCAFEATKVKVQTMPGFANGASCSGRPVPCTPTLCGILSRRFAALNRRLLRGDRFVGRSSEDRGAGGCGWVRGPHAPLHPCRIAAVCHMQA